MKLWLVFLAHKGVTDITALILGCIIDQKLGNNRPVSAQKMTLF